MSNTESNIGNIHASTDTGTTANRTSPSRGRHRVYNANNPGQGQGQCGKFSGKSVLEAKRLSQLALQRHAISQLKQVARPSTPPSRGTIAYTLGKDLYLVLRYFPLGFLNKVQSSISNQFNLTTSATATAHAASTIINNNNHNQARFSSTDSKGSQDNNNNNNDGKSPSQIPGKEKDLNLTASTESDLNKNNKTHIIDLKPDAKTGSEAPQQQNQLQCQDQEAPSAPSTTASIFNKASLITLMMKEKVYMLKNVNLNLISSTIYSPADSMSSKLSRFASSVASAKTKLITMNKASEAVEDSSKSSISKLTSDLKIVTKKSEGESSSNKSTEADVLSSSCTDWGLDPDLKPFMQENIHSEWKFVEARTRFLVSKIISVAGVEDTRALQIQHVEDLYRHLLQYRESRGTALECGAVKSLVQVLKSHSDDTCLVNCARETLAILGCNPPLKGYGIKVLSIDGGGVRGLVAIEVLRVIEKQTGKRIHELFDYICGVSTGSILAFLLGAHRCTLDECEALYMQLSQEIFTQNTFIGASNLLWSHSYYDTAAWEKILKRHIGGKSLMNLARDPDLPRVAAISTLVNQERVSPYVFRTYAFAPHVRSHYTGGCRHEMWEAVRASAAAPSYFEEIKLGPNLHQDGGVLVNNPTSVALSEAKTIWQGQPLQCVMSLGTGQTFSSRKNPNMSDLSSHHPRSGHGHGHGGHGGGHGHGRSSPNSNSSKQQADCSSLSWKGKFLKVLDSATDTEHVHYTLQELLPPHVYFRFNPYLNEMISMDEVKPERLALLQSETREYLLRNVDKVEYCCQGLTRPKGMTKRLYDWWNFQG